MPEQVKPKRIQRQRTRGWTMPAGAVYVGRPTKWGNPFKVSNGDCNHPDCGPRSHPVITRQMAVDSYRRWLSAGVVVEAVRELRGKDLCCWCPLSSPCHADILLEIANS